MSLWDKSAGAVPIVPSQLVVGLFVWLDLKWSEHPFMSNRMLIKTADDIAIMQSLQLAGRLYCFPDKSEVPLPSPPSESESAQGKPLVRATVPPVVPKQLQEQKKARTDLFLQQKVAAAAADRAWDVAARSTRDVLLTLAAAPKPAGAKLKALSTETAVTVAEAKQVLLHLLGHKSGGGQQFHAINTMTLSLLLGKRVGLSQQALTDLAMAALVHDSGKAEVPARILTLAKRNKYEENLYRQHLQVSLRYATESGMFSPEALEILADHHEAMDGSGWPSGKKDMGLGARILALVDRYDRLCTPEAVDVAPLVPMEALSTLLRRESSKFDPALLGFLIKLLGIYPPGTLVQLSDGSLGQVVAPGADSLRPKVLLYNSLTSKEEAQVLELDNAVDLKITVAIRPDSLPQEARVWLKPEQPQAFFVSTPAMNR
jgi:HD-GYP domain-containing protein (c-di-GMP phosphodiesterase class II)